MSNNSSSNTFPDPSSTTQQQGDGHSSQGDGRTAAVATTTVAGPLVGLLGGHVRGVGRMNIGDQRNYVGSLRSKVKLLDKTSTAEHVTAFKLECVRRLDEPLTEIAVGNTGGGQCIRQEFELSQTLADKADKRIDTKRGNTALNVNFVRNDHSAVIAHLMSAIGRYSQYGELSWELLTGGRDTIMNRDKIDGRIEEGSHIIYVPRVSAGDSSSYAWYAVVGACMGVGATVVTDATAVDQNHRVSLRPPNGSRLVQGCIEALTRIGNYYSHSNASVLFAYALARGAHMEMSVVGHTDEGGYMRKAFRRNRFVQSYGVIWLDSERMSSLAVPVVTSMESAARFFDSVALYSAAMSAVCDPLVEFNGDKYPTIVTAGTTDSTIRPHAPLSDVAIKQLKREQAARIYDVCSGWCKNMATMFDKMLGTTSDGAHSEAVSAFMQSALESMIGTEDRHLGQKVLAPFYWIEPQNLIGEEAKDMEACKHGFGYFVARNLKSIEVAPFEEGTVDMGTGSLFLGNTYIAFTAARKNALLQHLLNVRNDGLAWVIPMQTREDGLTLVGYDRARNEAGSFEERARAHNDIRSYMWRHASTNTIAPAEMLQLYKGMAVTIIFGAVDPNTLTHTQGFPGTSKDISMDNKVTYYPSQIQGIGIHSKRKPFDSQTVRNNALAAAALDTNRGLRSLIGDAFTVMPVSSSGAAPGLNIVQATWQEARRLIIADKEPESVWEHVYGKQQRTVVSHRLRQPTRQLPPSVSKTHISGPIKHAGAAVASTVSRGAGLEAGPTTIMAETKEAFVTHVEQAVDVGVGAEETKDGMDAADHAAIVDVQTEDIMLKGASGDVQYEIAGVGTFITTVYGADAIGRLLDAVEPIPDEDALALFAARHTSTRQEALLKRSQIVRPTVLTRDIFEPMQAAYDNADYSGFGLRPITRDDMIDIVSVLKYGRTIDIAFCFPALCYSLFGITDSSVLQRMAYAITTEQRVLNEGEEDKDSRSMARQILALAHLADLLANEVPEKDVIEWLTKIHTDIIEEDREQAMFDKQDETAASMTTNGEDSDDE